MRGPKSNPSNGKKSFFNFKKLRSLLICTAVFSIFVYLFVVNNSATLGIEISEYQRNIYNLQEENRGLEIEITNLQAISRIEALATNLDMVKVDHYNYIDSDIAVAVK